MEQFIFVPRTVQAPILSSSLVPIHLLTIRLDEVRPEPSKKLFTVLRCADLCGSLRLTKKPRLPCANRMVNACELAIRVVKM